MALVAANDDYPMGSDQLQGVPLHRRRVPAFYLDLTEVTAHKFFSKRPKPADWEYPDSFPITGVSWDEAVAYAEAFGKRLMDETEYEIAATRGGSCKFPWGRTAT